MPLLLAYEIDTLTVEDLKRWDQRADDSAGTFIDIIDMENLTDKRLQWLQSLVNERDQNFKSQAVDVDEVDARLQQISPRRSSSSSDTASTISTAGAEYTWEEQIDMKRISVYERYPHLKNIGGRPSRGINPDPGPCPSWKSDTDKKYHVSDHWGRECGQIDDDLARWLDFRWHQYKMREHPKFFNKYTETVYEYQQVHEINCAIQLHLKKQTKLDEWLEYYIYEHRKRRSLEEELNTAKRELDRSQESLTRAKQNGSVSVAPLALSEWWSKLVDYEKKILQAQKELKTAQERLKVLDEEVSFPDNRKDYLLAQAEEDLRLAEKKLLVQTSDEVEQIRQEVGRDFAKKRVAKAQGRVNWASTRLEKLDTLLEWIAEQFTPIATEYPLSSLRSQHKREVLEGWEGYYAFMRQRLDATQEREIEWRSKERTKKQTEAEDTMDDLRFPQERVRPLKALLAWIEQEFPDITAKSFGQGGSCKNDRLDQGNCRARPALTNSKSSVSKRKISHSGARESTRREGRSATEQLQRSLVQPSKVSKPRKSRRDTHSQILHCELWLSDTQAGEVVRPTKVAPRRSERISQRESNSVLSSTTLANTTEKIFRNCQNDTVRRSARLLDRTKAHTKELRSLQTNRDAEDTNLHLITGRKLRRRVTAFTKSSSAPQGISKTRHWNPRPRKG